MFTYDHNQNVENLDSKSRLLWIAVGCTLISSVFLSEAKPLGNIALLPLVAIIPLYFGVTGWDAIKAFYTQSRYKRTALSLTNSVRIALAMVGVAMIAVVYFAVEPLGYLSVLPLLAIIPIFTAIIGQDPVAVLYNLDLDQSSIDDNEPTYKVVDIKTMATIDKGRRVDDHYHIAA